MRYRFPFSLNHFVSCKSIVSIWVPEPVFFLRHQFINLCFYWFPFSESTTDAVGGFGFLQQGKVFLFLFYYYLQSGGGSNIFAYLGSSVGLETAHILKFRGGLEPFNSATGDPYTVEFAKKVPLPKCLYTEQQIINSFPKNCKFPNFSQIVMWDEVPFKNIPDSEVVVYSLPRSLIFLTEFGGGWSPGLYKRRRYMILLIREEAGSEGGFAPPPVSFPSEKHPKERYVLLQYKTPPYYTRPPFIRI